MSIALHKCNESRATAAQTPLCFKVREPQAINTIVHSKSQFEKVISD